MMMAPIEEYIAENAIKRERAILTEAGVAALAAAIAADSAEDMAEAEEMIQDTSNH
jgi:hypothetical protein